MSVLALAEPLVGRAPIERRVDWLVMATQLMHLRSRRPEEVPLYRPVIPHLLRMVFVEHPAVTQFARLKRIPKLDRLRLRGSNAAKDAFRLAATAQALRKTARLLPMPQSAMAG